MAQIMINGTRYTVTESDAEGFPRVTTERGRAYLLMPSHRNPADPNESYLIPEARSGRPFGAVLTWDGENITTIRLAETDTPEPVADEDQADEEQMLFSETPDDNGEAGTCTCGARYKAAASGEYVVYRRYLPMDPPPAIRAERNSDTVSDGVDTTWHCPFCFREVRQSRTAAHDPI